MNAMTPRIVGLWSGHEPLVADFQKLVLAPRRCLLRFLGRSEKAAPYFGEVVRIVPFLGLAPGGKTSLGSRTMWISLAFGHS